MISMRKRKMVEMSLPQIKINFNGKIISVSFNVFESIIRREVSKFISTNIKLEKIILDRAHVLDKEIWKKKYKLAELKTNECEFVLNHLKKSLRYDKNARAKKITFTIMQYMNVSLLDKSKSVDNTNRSQSTSYHNQNLNTTNFGKTQSFLNVAVKEENDSDCEIVEQHEYSSELLIDRFNDFSTTSFINQNLPHEIYPPTKNKPVPSFSAKIVERPNNIVGQNINISKQNRSSTANQSFKKNVPSFSAKVIGKQNDFTAFKVSIDNPTFYLKPIQLLLSDKAFEERKTPYKPKIRVSESRANKLKYLPHYPKVPPYNNQPNWKKVPVAPILSIEKNKNGIQLMWDLKLNSNFAKVKYFEVFYCKETNTAPKKTMWKKFKKVFAEKCPYVYNLEGDFTNHKYYFAVRAVDKHDRRTPFGLKEFVF